MKLNLTKPIVFLDLETTGVDPAKDRIVEISLAKIMPDGTREVKTRRLNPEMHIPEAASAIHGIYDKDVADCPTFREVSKSLWSYIEGCDFGGYNSNKFDIPVLVEEFLRAGVDIDLDKSRFIDVQNIFHRMEQRTLVAAYKFYCGKDLTGSQNVDFAGRIVYDDKGVEVFSFGKHKGRSVAEVFRTEPSYYSWMMNGDFPLHTKKVITAIRLRELSSKEH